MAWVGLKLFIVMFLIILSGFSMNDTRSWANDEAQTAQEKKRDEKAIPQDGEKKVSKTDHTLIIDGKELRYRAVAGELPIKQENGTAKGKVFYIAYELETTGHHDRPVTFVFNGGPGAASVWLHLGGLGPKRIKLTIDGQPLPPPVQYGENPYTWLTFTDLVFVDPMGTGFSRSIPDDEKTSRAFYGVQQDIQSVAEFIRLYLTRNSRWISPKFLVGESYGTTRVSGLTWHLHQRYGIDLNGVVLISPVLDFDTILFYPSHDLPYVLFLPTYAATVAYHERSPDKEHSAVREPLEDVESFCLEEYAALLAKGDDLKTEEKERLTRKLHEYTGLSPELLEEHHFRINWMDFTRNLLRKKRQTVGRMDSTITGTELNPADPYPAHDPSFDPLYGPFSSAMNSYVRDELKVESDLPYEFLNVEVSRNWDWSSGIERKQGFIDVSHTLRDAMAVNKHLKVFIASGIYDLATPYFTAKYTVSHMWLGQYKTNITIKNYSAGHMIYTHTEELKKLMQDAKDFYANSLRN